MTVVFFFQAEDGIRDYKVTGVQTCALPISKSNSFRRIWKNVTTLSPENSLYVLDLNNLSWYILKVIGNIPSSRAFHKTVLIGKYMVITFGKYNNYLIY